MKENSLRSYIAKDCALWKQYWLQLALLAPLYAIAGSLGLAFIYVFRTHQIILFLVWINLILGSILTIGAIVYYGLGIDKYRQSLAVVAAEMWVAIMWCIVGLISINTDADFASANLIAYAVIGLMFAMLYMRPPPGEVSIEEVKVPIP